MSYTTSSFKTRARTIDHLGREQIADCPTAISELWKNAYDAYARNVSLNIFDGKIPVATLVDDGHGMSFDDVENKWLTVGTESKATGEETSLDDRNGIQRQRVKQGQKGIGRLSCAALGSLMLLVSKKKNEKFVACLLDWRLFENPFLMLQDIKLPIVEFEVRSDIYKLLPEMFDGLMGNLWGDGTDTIRDSRVEMAWKMFHEQEESEDKESTKEQIENTVISTYFSDRHFDTWPVWAGEEYHGTAMFIASLHEDLIAQLSSDSGSEGEGSEVRSKETFKQTLNSFVNPLIADNDNGVTEFKTSVVAWNGALQRFIIDEVRSFDNSNFEQLEHIIEGEVSEEGLFTGKIKAFGEWHEDVTVKPKSRYKMRKDTRFGKFKIRLGTFEVNPKNSSLSDELHSTFDSIRQQYGGVMVFRDNLRVMPYGREDNDFFEMEKRRSKNAGLFVFTNRACFGGVNITKEHNPNLRDKAGREGIIDIKASKIFREIVEHILIEIAKRFIGRASTIRSEKLEEFNAKYAADKSAKDRRALLKKEQTRIKSTITKKQPLLINTHNELFELRDAFSNVEEIRSQDDLVRLRHEVNELDGKVKGYSLSPIPRTLGSIEQQYREYRDTEIDCKELIKQFNDSLTSAFDKLTVKDDIEIAEKNFKSKAGVLHAKINKLAKEGRSLLNSELKRFEEQVTVANKEFYNKITVYLDDLVAKRTTLEHVTKLIESEYQKQDVMISQQLKPYITAIESLKEQIDLEGLAIQSVNENSRLTKQIEQINSLAQLGISVEIIGHEIEGFDMTIERGIRKLNESELNPLQTNTLSGIEIAHQSLSDSWRFLSPLKLSGEKVKAKLTGNDIYNYVNNFFKTRLVNNDIKFTATSAFKQISIFEQPSRIYPVFINLINNARYWVKETTESERLVQLDVQNGLVYVSDNGSGVDVDDINDLFTIFFTKKQRGGRGVGLYLCKNNLIAGGHKIFYETNSNNKLLSGANFVIDFKGIKNANK